MGWLICLTLKTDSALIYRGIIAVIIRQGRSLCLDWKPVERRFDMLLMSTTNWIFAVVVVVIFAAVIGRKVKDKYY